MFKQKESGPSFGFCNCMQPAFTTNGQTVKLIKQEKFFMITDIHSFHQSGADIAVQVIFQPACNNINPDKSDLLLISDAHSAKWEQTDDCLCSLCGPDGSGTCLVSACHGT